MNLTTLFGTAALIAVVAFIIFAFRQGLKVKNPPEGVPPERFPGG